MLVTCAPDSNNLMGLTRFCHQKPLLKRRWQLQRLFEQGNKLFVLALALNRLGMHNKQYHEKTEKEEILWHQRERYRMPFIYCCFPITAHVTICA